MSLRRTGIARKTELRRSSPLKQKKAASSQRVRAARVRRDTGPSPAQRAQVVGRALGCCERCGVHIRPGSDYSIHHRLPRGRGGVNVLSNLVLLCGSGTTGCHGQVESQRAAAYDTGWLIRTGQSPAEVPVLVHDRGHVLLTDDGNYLEAAA